jgi:hypothetical protein
MLLLPSYVGQNTSMSPSSISLGRWQAREPESWQVWRRGQGSRLGVCFLSPGSRP